MLPNRFYRFFPLALLTASVALAQGTRQWTTSRLEEFERGTPQSVSLRNDGRLEAAPALTPVAATSATYVWAVAVDTGGNTFAGTGAVTGGSQLLKIDKAGKSTVIADFKEANVQAVQTLSDGSVLAATSPDGKVYRVVPGAKPVIVFDGGQTAEKPRYIWSLATEKSGDLLVAAGSPAAIYRVRPGAASATPELLFKSADQHIRCLLVAPDGTIYAGSDGAGIVYRLTPAGKGFALYAAPKHEITSLALDPEGNLYAAAVGDKRAPALPALPAQSLSPVPNVSAVASSTSATGSISFVPSVTSIPEGSAIYKITADGLAVQLLALRDDVAYSVAYREKRLFVGTGNHGRIYRIDPSAPGSFTDVAHVDARETTALLNVPDGLLVATGSSGRLLKLSDKAAADATYTSEVFDGEVAARWGRAELTGSATGVSLFARSGNIENPQAGLGDVWSEWKGVAADVSPLPVPNARYMQWKAVLKPGATLAAVTINYLPRNLPPQIDDVVVQPGARLPASSPPVPATTVPIAFRRQGAAAAESVAAPEPVTSPLIAQRDRTSITARWLARDPNGDDLVFALYFRDVHETDWHLIKDKISERAYSFDSTLLPDGEYELRVVASDAPGHMGDDTLSAERISAPFTVDTTPPVPGVLNASIHNGQLHATIEVRDTTSPIAHAEFSVDARPWQYLEPVGKLSDSLLERYDVTVPVAGAGEHTIAMRFFDRYENVTSVKAIAR